MSEHKYLLRVPSDLWSAVQREASLARRSANSEIVWRLSQSFAPGAPTYPSLAAVTGPAGEVVLEEIPQRVVGSPVADRRGVLGGTAPAPAVLGQPPFTPDFKEGKK